MDHTPYCRGCGPGAVQSYGKPTFALFAYLPNRLHATKDKLYNHLICLVGRRHGIEVAKWRSQLKQVVFFLTTLTKL